MNLLNDVNGGLFLKRAGGRLNLASPLLHIRGIFWGRGGSPNTSPIRTI